MTDFRADPSRKPVLMSFSKKNFMSAISPSWGENKGQSNFLHFSIRIIWFFRRFCLMEMPKDKLLCLHYDWRHLNSYGVEQMELATCNRQEELLQPGSWGHELGNFRLLKKTLPPLRWNLSIFWYIQNINLALFWLILHFLGDFKRLCYQLPLKSGNFLFENIDSVDRIVKVERRKYAFYIRLMYLCLWIVTLGHYNFVDFPLEIF